MSALEVERLALSFGSTPVLTDVSLTVAPHSITAVLGASGSGKTTLLRVVAGFERPDLGQVRLSGRVVEGAARHVPPEQRHLGYVPQDAALFPHLNVTGNVGFGLTRGERRSARVSELLDLVGLSGLGARYPHELSGGQQQRVALARALAAKPSLVLLDEPFSSLDAALRLSVRVDITRVLRESGCAVVLVTHDQQEALSMADEVAVLRNGTIAQVGRPRDIYAHPIDPALATFLGEANLIDATIEGARALTAFGPLPALAAPGQALIDGAATVLIRPEQLVVAAAATGREGGGLAGRVVESTYHGHESVIVVVADEPSGAGPIRIRTSGGDSYASGDAVIVSAAGPVTAWSVPLDGPR